MKHVAWVFIGFQTHSGRCRCGVETVQVGQSVQVQGICGLDFPGQVQVGSAKGLSNFCGVRWI